MKSLSLFQAGILILLIIIVIEGGILISKLGNIPTSAELSSPDYAPQGLIGQLWRIGNSLGDLQDRK